MSAYIVVGSCQFVEDNKGTSHMMVGFYYCAIHKCRTASAAQACIKGERETKKQEANHDSSKARQ